MIRPLSIHWATRATVAFLLIAMVAFIGQARAIDIQPVVSPGGIKAWLVRDTSVPVLSIEFSFRGGRTYDPADKAGLSSLLSGLLDEGAGSLDSRAFQAELQNHSIKMNFSSGRDTFRGSLKMLNKHRERAIELLDLALTKPRFDSEPLERMRQQSLISLKRRSTNPDYIAGRTWATAVFGDHPYAIPSSGTPATIANITGVSQSIEPTYQNLYVKSNLSGEFTVVNPYLVNDLKSRDLWDKVMVNDLKYYDGSVQTIDRVPADLKAKYATAFEVEPRWLVDSASRRQKWIDQAQSLNLYINNASGKKLDVTYRMAWFSGLKTTYYLRSLAATGTEKSTVDTGNLNAVSNATAAPQPAPVPQACSLDDPDCEACQ